MPSDVQFIRRALELAQLGSGLTFPNPRVGAVLVRGGKIIGEGFHLRAGTPHAEVHRRRRCKKARPSRRGRNALRHARALLDPRPHPAVHRTDPTRKNRTRRLRRDRSNPNHAGAAARLLKKQGVRVSMVARERSDRTELRFQLVHHEEAPVGRREDRTLARWPHHHAARR